MNAHALRSVIDARPKQARPVKPRLVNQLARSGLVVDEAEITASDAGTADIAVTQGHLIDLFASAVGACADCFGMDAGCSSCQGRGMPGTWHPDPDAFAFFVVPALMRQGVRTDAASQRNSDRLMASLTGTRTVNHVSVSERRLEMISDGPASSGTSQTKRGSPQG